MRSGRVQIVGGGPAGLYLALLLRRRSTRWQVTVTEPTAPAETFGFGVGFTGTTLRRLSEADPESHGAILRAAHENPIAEFRLPQGAARVQFAGNVAISRATLLSLLAERAELAGVEIRWGCSADAAYLAADADLVVAADGAGSPTRARLEAELEPSLSVGRGLFLWCGADTALPCSVFATARTEDGVFVAHAYPYGGDRSTFLIETDEPTWTRSGLATAAAAAPPGQTDEASLAFLQDAFAPVLGGASLIGNRTQWRRFRTISLRRWSAGTTVLVGDAAHTAHYSIGSGTKMAMEDGVALADALASEADVRAAFARYEKTRKSAVTRLQALAQRSREWWESFPKRAHLPAEQLALGYLTRAGNVSLDDVRARDPDVLRRAAAQLGAADDREQTILALPLEHPRGRVAGRVIGDPGHGGGETEVGCRITQLWEIGRRGRQPAYIEVSDISRAKAAQDRFPTSLIGASVEHFGSAWSGEADATLRAARAAARAGCDSVRLASAGRTRADTLTLLDISERVRLATGAVTVATVPTGHVTDGVAAIASGRVQLLSLR